MSDSKDPAQSDPLQIGRFLFSSGEFGPWRIRETQEIFRNDFLRLARDQVVRPDGGPGEHVVVAIKPGVCVVALDEENHVRLTREFHYAVGRETVEAVSGGIDQGETALACAHRELQEELGLKAAQMEWMTTVDPFTSIMVSPTALFLARGLSRVPAAPEATELIGELSLPLSQAVAMVADGRITHAPSCVAILLTASRLATGQ